MPCVNRAVDVRVRLEIFGSESFSVWELYSVALGLGFLCVCVYGVLGVLCVSSLFCCWSCVFFCVVCVLCVVPVVLMVHVCFGLLFRFLHPIFLCLGPFRSDLVFDSCVLWCWLLCVGVVSLVFIGCWVLGVGCQVLGVFQVFWVLRVARP